VGNPVSQTSQAITLPASGSTDLLIREWLFRFGLNFGKDVVPFLPLWLETFGTMKPEVIEPLFQRALRTCKFMPTIAEILAPLEEDEWQNVLEYLERYVYPDFVFRSAPPLPADIYHAVRAAGGLRYIESCSADDLVWAKQRFCEDLVRQRKIGNVAKLLASSELRRLLDATAQRLRLPSTDEVSQPATETRSAAQVLEGFRNSETGPTYRRCPRHNHEISALISRGEKSFGERNKKVIAATQEAIEKYKAEHGLLPGTNPPLKTIDVTPVAVSEPTTAQETTELATVGADSSRK